jgi:hypothetical protein
VTVRIDRLALLIGQRPRLDTVKQINLGQGRKDFGGRWRLPARIIVVDLAHEDDRIPGRKSGLKRQPLAQIDDVTARMPGLAVAHRSADAFDRCHG